MEALLFPLYFVYESHLSTVCLRMIRLPRVQSLETVGNHGLCSDWTALQCAYTWGQSALSCLLLPFPVLSVDLTCQTEQQKRMENRPDSFLRDITAERQRDLIRLEPWQQILLPHTQPQSQPYQVSQQLPWARLNSLM